MGQNRKKRKGQGDVALSVFAQEKKEDIQEEKRLFTVECLVLVMVFVLVILRELIFPSQLFWIQEIRAIITLISNL